MQQVEDQIPADRLAHLIRSDDPPTLYEHAIIGKAIRDMEQEIAALMLRKRAFESRLQELKEHKADSSPFTTLISSIRSFLRREIDV
ncbi:hypothetical protein D9611_014151 [Ephemerocybe angulata]|uniref:Uncharacterized protein n=1 Tax=Ephemerocybe angulata TaxID=980116 RepID=A0A8H5C549_9AGAR|nr:hypothetical protein D9611_014151 [Tulosesus angulatus]